MRAGEIFDLTWGRVNMKEGFHVLTQQDTKREESRYVYLNGPVREIPERLGGVRCISHNHVFTYQGNPVRSIKIALATALQEAGIKMLRGTPLRI